MEVISRDAYQIHQRQINYIISKVTFRSCLILEHASWLSEWIPNNNRSFINWFYFCRFSFLLHWIWLAFVSNVYITDKLFPISDNNDGNLFYGLAQRLTYYFCEKPDHKYYRFWESIYRENVIFIFFNHLKI